MRLLLMRRSGWPHGGSGLPYYELILFEIPDSLTLDLVVAILKLHNLYVLDYGNSVLYSYIHLSFEPGFESRCKSVLRDLFGADPGLSWFLFTRTKPVAF